ncbi:hypothetical protein SUGI_0063370 [Cryptomeria japonica]|nr:hypothetical protein SUGI_0063370 [Cryptomeria japonica]
MDLKKISEAEAKIKALEAENTEMRETLNAVRKQLAVFESLILYPTYFYELERFPESQKGMVELAMKANFFKTSHEIRQKTEENMKEIWSRRNSGSH